MVMCNMYNIYIGYYKYESVFILNKFTDLSSLYKLEAIQLFRKIFQKELTSSIN